MSISCYYSVKSPKSAKRDGWRLVVAIGSVIAIAIIGHFFFRLF